MDHAEPASAVAAESTRQHTSLLILAGGRASRLGGVRKTMLRVAGRAILERIVDQLGPLADECLALVHDADVPAPRDLRLLVDAHEYAGPLPAVAHALAAVSGDLCLLVAGDMPFVSNAAFRHMLRRQREQDAAVVVPYIDGHIESMHAVFRRRDLVNALELAQRDGEQRLFKVFESLNAVLIDEAELRAIDPDLRTLFNVNSRDDLTRAEQIAAAQESTTNRSQPE